MLRYFYSSFFGHVSIIRDDDFEFIREGFFICKGENKSGGMWYVDLNSFASEKQLSSSG